MRPYIAQISLIVLCFAFLFSVISLVVGYTTGFEKQYLWEPLLWTFAVLTFILFVLALFATRDGFQFFVGYRSIPEEDVYIMDETK